MVTNSHDAVGKMNLDIQSFKYTWVIDYLDFNFKKAGEKMRSSKFKATIDETPFEWQLWLYPKGVKGHNGKTVSIALYNLTKNIVTASVSFGIVNDENKVVKIKVTDKKTYNTQIDAEAMWGFREFIETSFISNKDNGLIHSSLKIMIECEITVYISCDKDREKQEECVKEEEKTRRLEEFDRYESLIDSNAFSDVSFMVEGQILNAHKCILVKSSPVFTAMFQNEMREKQERMIEIEDIKHSAFAEMLRFIYAGKINLEVDNIELSAGELLFAADKYDIDGLKDKCEKLMCKTLCLDKVVDMLKIADRHSVYNLKAKAIKLIVSRSNNVLRIPNFKSLTNTPDLLCEVCIAIAYKKK